MKSLPALPTEIAEAAAVVAANHRRKIDVGYLQFTTLDGARATRMFANIASFGVSGVVDRLVNKSGKKLGTHKGIIRYTVGQRRGLGLALPQSMYVCEKDVKNNRVVLGFNEDLFSKEVSVGDIVLSACDSLEKPEHLSAKIRYNQKEQPATVIQTDKDKLKIIFDEPQRAVTKGQAAVVYDGDTVIGGGTIL